MTSILVVDDSAVDRAVARELLQREGGWQVEQAGDGQAALTRMQESPPDIVVTDLQMPGMDGLELVTVAREDYPHLPVILMTAHGSESLALEALERGAASYVPKSHLVDMLLPTVKQVLLLARTDRRQTRLSECLTATEFTYCLENDLSLIDALVDVVQGIVGGIGLCDTAGRLRVGMALAQALHNALYWGNLELTRDDLEEAREQLLLGKEMDLIVQRRTQMPYRDRRMFVLARIGPEEAHFVVRDEGPGFNTTTLPGANHPRDLEQEAGRGLVLMRAFMDEVTYNDVGNEVTMVKQRDPAAANASSRSGSGHG